MAIRDQSRLLLLFSIVVRSDLRLLLLVAWRICLFDLGVSVVTGWRDTHRVPQGFIHVDLHQ